MDFVVLTVGDELLSGQTVNTNAAWLCRYLVGLGHRVIYTATVPDETNVIEEAVDCAFRHGARVITTGGLGPTRHDVTKEGVCAALGLDLKRQNKIIEEFKHTFVSKRLIQFNERQAYFPNGQKILKNTVGTAPGALLESEGRWVCLLPGPPSEMQKMFEDEVAPMLKNTGDIGPLTVLYMMGGLSEAEMVDRLRDTEMPEGVVLAPYARRGNLCYEATISGKNEWLRSARRAQLDLLMRRRFGRHWYGNDGLTLEQALFSLFERKSLSVAAAESVTGGLVAAQLINVAGMSRHLSFSYIVYSDEAKAEVLGLDADFIRRYGAVSAEVAEQMVQALLKKSDTAVATTGFAGPGERAGEVYVGVGYGRHVEVQKCRLPGERNTVRHLSVKRALFLLYRLISRDELL